MSFMKEKNKMFMNNILCVILSVFSSISLCLKINKNYNISINFFALFISVIILYFCYQKNISKSKKSFKILSLILSLFMIVGYSFKVNGNFTIIVHNILLLFISLIKLIGFYYLFLFSTNTIFEFINKYKFKSYSNKVYKFIFEKHPFILPFIIIIICYLPYIISFYPGILSPDPSNQIKQFFHIKTKYLDYSILLDPNVYITNHHPVLHTVLLGGLAKVGDIIGSVNVGIFMYSIIQICTLVGTLSYTIYYMKKINTPSIIRVISLIIYSLVPVFPFYAMSVVKDVMFNCFVILFCIKIFDIIKDENLNFKNGFILVIIMLLVTMLRNNGIYAILFAMPFMIAFMKKIRKNCLFVTLITLTIYLSYAHILLPALKITPGSIREVLSIPFQQTARYVKYHENELSDYDKGVIDKVLGIDDLVSRYNPLKADPVKNAFNKYASNDDLKDYFKVWFKGLVKHPNVYIEATLHNTYGYFYPNHSWYIYYKYDERLINDGINYHYNNLNGLRNILSCYGVGFQYIPLLGYIVNIAFCNWIVLFVVFIVLKIKKYKYLIWLAPTISLILVCFASPVNTYFRYAIGIVFQIPIIISMCYYLVNKNNE